MKQLSVVIITYNEERNIGRCLQSVHDIASETVVLDSFSTDRTEEICRKYAVKFHQHAFDGYIAQKNRALELATSPYVLSLDADEALSPELKESIKKVLLQWDADAYTFNRLTNFCGHWVKHTGWYPDRKLRLWDKRKGQWQGHKIHEKVEMQPSAHIQHIRGDLLHYSFYSVQQHIKQINAFSTLKAEAAFEKKKKGSIFKLIMSPLARFFSHYIVKGGFRDGFYGLVISANSAHSAFLKQVKLIELHRNKKQS